MALVGKSLFAAALLAVGLPAASASAQGACAPHVLRWEDDCSALHDQPREGLNALRYAPLDGAGRAWVTFGGQYRVRVDGADEPSFGLTGVRDYVSYSQRALVHADVRTQWGPRAFLQLSAADEEGRSVRRDFDQSDLDLAQGFIDVPFALGDRRFTIRGGRQEMTLGGNRLLALRDGTTLRRSFNGLVASMSLGNGEVTAFRLRPTTVQVGMFDDRAEGAERFQGLNWRLGTDPRGVGAWTVFLFERRRDVARYATVSGAEDRYALGATYRREAGPLTVIGGAVAQFGDVGGQDLRAWGGWLDFEYDLPDDRTTATLAFGLGSGDRKIGDGEINTYDPLYPNPSSLTDAPLFRQSNLAHVQGEVLRRYGPVTIGGDAVLAFRDSRADGLYVFPGGPVSASLGDARPVTFMYEGIVRWDINSALEFRFSVQRAEALSAVKDAGGRSATFGRLQIGATF